MTSVSVFGAALLVFAIAIDLLVALSVSLLMNRLLRGKVRLASWLCGAAAPSALLIALALSVGPEPPGSVDAHGMIIVSAFLLAVPLIGLNAVAAGLALLSKRS